jgi:hypothetical protein
MVIVKIVSGPRAGQQNLVPMKPEDLAILSKEGWRWEVDWHTVPDDIVLKWAINDMINKIVSALIRGASVQFLDQIWVSKGSDDFLELAQEIEDAVVYGGYNVMVASDTEERLSIGTAGTEHPVQ